MLTLKLPWPPSVNHYKKIGRMVKTKSGKMYQQRVNTRETSGFYYNVYIEGKKAMPPEWPELARSATIEFELRVSLHPPDNRRRDIDNGLKVLLDSLVHAHLICDDSQITRLYVQKMENRDNGQVILQIIPIGDRDNESLPRADAKET